MVKVREVGFEKIFLSEVSIIKKRELQARII